MNITTKYNIGDTVWFMLGSKPTEYEIQGIKAYVKLNAFYVEETIIVYEMSSNAEIGLRKANEKLLFPTKEDLIATL